MNRRALLALLPLPWLGKLLPRCTDARTWPLPEGIPVSQFVCRKPEEVLLLRENMRIDIYAVPPWWRRLWNRLRPPEPEPPAQRITKIDHENRIVTYE